MESINRSFLWNNVRVKLVGVHPETHIALYINNGHGGVIGVQVHPNGTKRQINAAYCKNENSNKAYCGGQKPYLQFRDAFGHHKPILASHAVYIAWVGLIEPGMTIDHINGCTTYNDYRNLRQVSGAVNSRDGAFLRKLKKAGFNVMAIDRVYLLRFFDRMAQVKEVLSYKAYRDLTKAQLRAILYDPEFSLSFFFHHQSQKIDMLDIH